MQLSQVKPTHVRVVSVRMTRERLLPLATKNEHTPSIGGGFVSVTGSWPPSSSLARRSLITPGRTVLAAQSVAATELLHQEAHWHHDTS
jgi:hypothetical protein